MGVPIKGERRHAEGASPGLPILPWLASRARLRASYRWTKLCGPLPSGNNGFIGAAGTPSSCTSRLRSNLAETLPVAGEEIWFSLYLNKSAPPGFILTADKGSIIGVGGIESGLGV